MSESIDGIGISEQDAWNRVLGRDRSADGEFVYAVRTTGIFCRPSCPSRRPKRQNVEFFASHPAALAAGYRACYRCHPTSEHGTPTEKRLRRAIDYIDQHLNERITLKRLSKAVGLSAFHLQRTFRDALGVSPREFQDARRLQAMKTRLQSGMTIGRAAWEAGYGSYRGAYDSVSGGVGMTPGAYRNGGRGISINYATHDTGLGTLLVAWTPKGVCAVYLGESDQQLVGELSAEFSAAELERDQDTGDRVRPFIDYLEGQSGALIAPLDTAGTAFQLRVWRALQEIPLGEVRSYAQIAQAIGRPSAVRAVANACAANRTALIVPCHRVIRSDGSIGGYRWHPERKVRLLEHEGAMKDNLQDNG